MSRALFFVSLFVARCIDEQETGGAPESCVIETGRPLVSRPRCKAHLRRFTWELAGQANLEPRHHIVIRHG
jgi:hypothetical protein